MKRVPKLPWPQRTTFWAGLCLLVSSTLALLTTTHAVIAITRDFPIALNGPVFRLAAEVLLAAGFVVLAIGVRGEVGIVAESRAGRVALVLFGVHDLVDRLLDGAGSDPQQWLILLGLAFQALTVLSIVVAAALVVRVRVLLGPVRWALVPLAAAEVLLAALATIPVPEVGLALATWDAGLLPTVLLLGIGVAFLLYGRSEAVKHRLQVISDAW